ncbi:MAG TPA: hypothetical protein VFG71_10780 [Nitrospiraceae bacterium]|nr:hypothetical protein [Nitrospiraceae bacterium]
MRHVERDRSVQADACDDERQDSECGTEFRQSDLSTDRLVNSLPPVFHVVDGKTRTGSNDRAYRSGVIEGLAALRISYVVPGCPRDRQIETIDDRLALPFRLDVSAFCTAPTILYGSYRLKRHHTPERLRESGISREMSIHHDSPRCAHIVSTCKFTTGKNELCIVLKTSGRTVTA